MFSPVRVPPVLPRVSPVTVPVRDNGPLGPYAFGNGLCIISFIHIIL